MSRAAEDAAHWRAVLADDIESPFYRNAIQAFMESVQSDSDRLPHLFHYDATVLTRSGDEELEDMRITLRAGETFYVAAHMMNLAQSIAETMPDEPLLPYDLPSTQGFMWYQRPFRLIDVRRKLLSDNCILWSARGGAVKVWHFTHRDDPIDSVNLHLRNRFSEEEYRRIPMLNLNHTFTMGFGEPLPRGISWDTPLPWDAQMQMTEIDNGDGTYAVQFATDAEMDIREDPKVVRSPLASFIVCLWRLCQQSITSLRVEEPPRHARRRMLRARLPVSPITVITLRRVSGPRHEEANVEWQHSWMVRGHWRRQPYRETNAEGAKQTIYRYIYIHPYLKGDPDKPLLHREKVNALLR